MIFKGSHNQKKTTSNDTNMSTHCIYGGRGGGEEGEERGERRGGEKGERERGEGEERGESHDGGGFLQEAGLCLSDKMRPYKERDGGSGDFSSESCDFQLL